MIGNNAAALVNLFGGNAKMHAATGIDPATISRMQSDGKRGYHGRVPPRFNADIIRGARAARLKMAQVRALLEPNACPCCGRTLEPGAMVSVDKLRAALAQVRQ